MTPTSAGRLRFAILGTGFWSRFQLAGWRELEGAECVALYNRTRSRAEALGRDFGIDAVYDDAEKLLDSERLDFVDVITDVDTHGRFVGLAAERGLPVICQKPMAPTLDEARSMVETTRRAGVAYFVHENFRWQRPIRELRRLMREEPVGEVHRARITFTSAFPVFDNQPFLKELEQFILTDVGSHILDVVRFLFGEAEALCCHTRRTREDIRGENVATVLLRMRSGASVICELGYASRTRHECFPQTRILVEGPRGSLELDADYWIHLTLEEAQRSERFAPVHYPWANPDYDVVHASIVSCNEDLLRALRGQGEAETTGSDNLETMRLVFASYESAASGKTVSLG
jgi:predicted dehydrogenase